MSHAGVSEERLNLIVFQDADSLGRILRLLDIKVVNGDIFETSDTHARCGSCGKPLTVNNLGNLMPGSNQFYCDEPTHLAEYISQHYPSMQDTRLDFPLLYSQLTSSVQSEEVIRILGRTIVDFNKFADKYALPQGDKVYANIVGFDDESIGWCSDLYKHSVFGFCRETLLPFQVGLMNQPKWHKEIIRRLKPYLDSKDHEALVLAYTLIKREDEWEINAENSRKLRGLRTDFEKKYGENGRRIYNMGRSKFMEELIFPSIEICESEIEDKEKRELEVRGMFYKFLNQNPMNVYVNEQTVNHGFINELTTRLVNLNEPIVRTYARGKNWDQTLEMCQEYVSSHDEYGLHVQTYRIFGSLSGCCRVWRKRLGSVFEIERMRELEELQRIDTGETTSFVISLEGLLDTMGSEYFGNLCLMSGMSREESDATVSQVDELLKQFFEEKGLNLNNEARSALISILVDCMQRTDRVMRQYDPVISASDHHAS